MQEKIFLQKNIIIGVVILLALLGVGYYWYSSSVFGSENVKIIELDPSLYNDEVKNFYAVRKKISLDKTDFLNKDFYKKLENYSETIPSVTPPGRLNPFVPYVAP